LDDQTPWHLLNECPATLPISSNIPPDHWSTSTILKAIKKSEDPFRSPKPLTTTNKLPLKSQKTLGSLRKILYRDSLSIVKIQELLRL
jgi:hypothetical protein